MATGRDGAWCSVPKPQAAFTTASGSSPGTVTQLGTADCPRCSAPQNGIVGAGDGAVVGGRDGVPVGPDVVGDMVGCEVVGDTVGPEVVGEMDGDTVGPELVGDSVRSRRRSYSVSSTVSSVNPPEWPVTDPRLAVPTKFTISVSRIEHSYRGPGS